jgi:rfaE bifunctional protein nucleotidyltransferase chain/domain
MPLVLVNGCFDVLHVGHVRLLEWSSQFGDVWVALNSDESVRELKGPNRPIYGEDERREMLLALRCVSDVWVFGERTPNLIIARLNPDVIVVGSDHSLSDSHYTAARRRGAQLRHAPNFGPRRSSKVIELEAVE